MKRLTEHEIVNDYSRIAMKVANVCIIANFMLCLLKLTGGIAAGSRALISDGINSAFDVISGIIVIIGAKLAGKNPDKEHPYGHERFENVATIVLAVILFVTGVFVGHTALESLLGGTYKTNAMPGVLSIIAALISMAAKETMFWYTASAADKINSVSLKAAAWDHRADVISTLGALIGIMLARYGLSAADLIASLIVCVFIIRTAYIVFREAMKQMTDRSADDSFLRELESCILAVDGVLGIDMLQVRAFGSRYYVDLEISEDGNRTLAEAHATAEQVHDAIEDKYPVVKHIMVHVNPKVKE